MNAMKKKSLNLNQLKVKSFVTDHQVANGQTVKGGKLDFVDVIQTGNLSANRICPTVVKTCGVCPDTVIA